MPRASQAQAEESSASGFERWNEYNMQCLVAVGACYLDTILTVDRYPCEDEKLRASVIEKRRGGNVPNSLEVLQQLLRRQVPFVPPILLSVLPAASSIASQQITSSLRPGVDLSHCLHRNSSTEAPSSYIIRSDATDSRTIVNFNNLTEMTLKEFMSVADSLCNKAQVYHFEGRIPDITAKCINYLRERHSEVKVTVEIEKPNRPGLQELARAADVVFYSKSWAQAQGYQTAGACLEAQRDLIKKASYLFCTWGAEGASAIAAAGSATLHSPVFVPKGSSGKVLDTIGAGDTFIAGVLYGLFFERQPWGLLQILEFANELAGRKVMQAGFSGLSE